MNENESQNVFQKEEKEEEKENNDNKENINNEEKNEELINKEDKSDNLENKEEKNKDNDNKEIIENMNKKIFEYETKIKGLQQLNDSLNIKITESLKNSEIINNEKINLGKINKQLESNIKVLKEKYNQIKSEKETIISQKETEINKLNKSIEEINNKSHIINQASKQIFLQYLTNDIYIEQIEKCFNIQDINKYFDNIYKLSEYIRPNIIIDYWKNILAKNKDLVNNIEKYNLDTSLDKILKGFNNIKKLEEVNKKENQEFIVQLLQEMTDYITNLRKTIMKQSNSIEEIKNQKKVVENNVNNLIKNENKNKEEIKNYINKISELNNKINSLNIEINKYKKEIEKLSKEKKDLLDEKTKSIQSESSLTEKVSNSIQKCELYKIENFELMNKITTNKAELEEIKLKNENLKKQIELYKEKTSNMEKMSETLKEQDSQLIIKDNEINKLKKSYEELEEFFENLKQEKENLSQNSQKQINELLEEKKNLEKILEEQNKKFSEITDLNDGNKNLNEKVNTITKEKYEELNNKIFNLELDNTNLKEQNNKLVKINKDLVTKLQNNNKNYEKVVDKTMISSMLIKYFNPSTPNSIKNSLLETISNFLEFSDEEREQIGLNSKSNYVDNSKGGGNLGDHLSKLGNNLYNFITNS